MEYHLVSLERTPQRREAFARNNPWFTNYEWFRAIDGSQLDDVLLREQGLIDGTARYTRGAIGVALSMLSLWQRSLESGRPLTIVEDDVFLHPRFEQLVEATVARLPSDWDLIHWGWNFDAALTLELIPGLDACTLFFDQDSLGRTLPEWRAADPHPQPCRLRNLLGTPCYSVSPRGAELLMGHVFPLRQMWLDIPGIDGALENRGFDCAANAVYADSLSYACFPPLVLTLNDHAASTVQTGDAG